MKDKVFQQLLWQQRRFKMAKINMYLIWLKLFLCITLLTFLFFNTTFWRHLSIYNCMNRQRRNGIYLLGLKHRLGKERDHKRYIFECGRGSLGSIYSKCWNQEESLVTLRYVTLRYVNLSNTNPNPNTNPNTNCNPNYNRVKKHEVKKILFLDFDLLNTA